MRDSRAATVCLVLMIVIALYSWRDSGLRGMHAPDSYLMHVLRSAELAASPEGK